MSDYIRKADAVDAVEFGITTASAINIETGERTELFQRENDELRKAVKRIKDIEPADVVQVRHGRWEKDWWHGEKTRRCSACNITQTVNVYKGEVKFNYCPYCGAKMDKE